MKLLVLGNGGREHTLADQLLQSSRVSWVYCLPGNGGTQTLERAENVPLGLDDFAAIADFAKTQAIAAVIVGPEAPLAAGITDYLQAQGIAVFGPSQAGAALEASKTWAKGLMMAAGVPTAKAASFSEAAAAIAYVQAEGAPIVIKADGLAAGKGVTVATTVAEAITAIEAAFGGQFGAAGDQVLIEECLVGEEVSVLALCDGLTVRPLLPAQDHKRIGEGDTGANTGGMGAYAPVPWVTPALMQRIQTEVLEPTLRGLQAKGIDYRGVLYAGLMITPAGDPKVIEFNCRFGDPETQVVLPLLATPLIDLILACIEQRLSAEPELAWHPAVAAAVVMAAAGYPGSYAKGQAITNLAQAAASGVKVFHAGTRAEAGQIFSDGGRVLNVVATGPDFQDALGRVYQAIAQIQFPHSYYRRDIGHRILAKQGG
jgi:phosphoribosylamine---glycine ligase